MHVGMDQASVNVDDSWVVRGSQLTRDFCVAARRSFGRPHVIPVASPLPVPVFPIRRRLDLVPQLLAYLSVIQCLEKGLRAIREMPWVDERPESKSVSDVRIDVSR